MAAITWRNVEGRSLAEAAVPLREAGDLMEKGLGTFDRMLQQRNAVQSNNWDAGKINNTNELKLLLASAKTPEELAALEGQINEKAAGYNGQVDADVLRTGMRDQLTTLRTQGTADHAYQKTQREQAVAPHVEAFNQAVAKRDWATAKAISDAQDLGANEATMYATAEEGIRTYNRQRESEKRADEIAPIQHQATLTSLADQAEVSKNTRQLSSLQQEAAATTARHREQQLTYGKMLGDMGRNYTDAKGNKGLPVDSQGQIRLDLLNSDQHAWLKTQTNNMPGMSKSFNILEEFQNGDTRAADAFLKTVEGKYNPAIVEQAREALRQNFNTDSYQTEVGRTANTTRTLNAQQEALDKANTANNWYAPGSQNAMTDYAALKAELPDLLDQTSGWDADEDVAPMGNFIHEMATKGIDVGDGKMVTPSINDLRAVISGARGSYFFDSTRANNARKALLKHMRDNGTLDKIREGEAIQSRNLKRDAEAILKNK